MIYRCPTCSSEFQSDIEGLVICPNCQSRVRVELPIPKGCAWDLAPTGNLVSAFFEAIKLSIVNPIKFFSEVGEGQGLVRPWIFAVIIFIIVFGVAAAYQAGFQMLAIGVELVNSIEKTILPTTALSFPFLIGFIFLFVLVGAPILTSFTVFIQSCIYHLCLLILGAAGRSFRDTFRTVCYTSGPQLFHVIPFFGGLIGPIWQFVLLIIGIKVVHKTTYGKSVLAVFLPTIVCCGLVLVIVATIAGGVAAGFLKSALH